MLSKSLRKACASAAVGFQLAPKAFLQHAYWITKNGDNVFEYDQKVNTKEAIQLCAVAAVAIAANVTMKEVSDAFDADENTGIECTMQRFNNTNDRKTVVAKLIKLAGDQAA